MSEWDVFVLTGAGMTLGLVAGAWLIAAWRDR